MACYIALDIGGSHITSGLVNFKNSNHKVEYTFHQPIDNNATVDQLLANITDSIVNVSNQLTRSQILKGIAVSMPGPFNYKKGVSRIEHKFNSLFALDLKTSLSNILAKKDIQVDQITFLNDAQSFLLGVLHQKCIHSEKVLAITLGTGIGSASYSGGELFSGLLDENPLYNSSFKTGIAEDYFSTKWFLNQAAKKGIGNGTAISGVKELAMKAEDDQAVQQIFDHFGKNLAEYLDDLISQKQVDRIVFGGKIFHSFHLFEDSFRDLFTDKVWVQIVDNTSEYSLLGAAFDQKQNGMGGGQNKIRKSVSPVLPIHKKKEPEGYDIYPTFPLSDGKIKMGYHSLMEFIHKQGSNQIVIDGNVGTIWEEVISCLNREFISAETDVNWYCIEAAHKSESEIDSMLEGYLGGDDPLFGFHFPGQLKDFFDEQSLSQISSDKNTLSILYGTGASLAGWEAPVIYIDQPKNEIQYRSRAGSVTNIGSSDTEEPKIMYKRFYFVDWPVCNKHKQELLGQATAIGDGQRPGAITWIEGDDFRAGLERMVQSPFRVRPWFEPGVWGGHWMQDKFEGLNPDAKNYAWSFEIIAPENGVIFESDGIMLEFGFEFLLYHKNKAILGRHADEYGYYFPLRFDYLDTMDGQNLSLQCHPTLEYMKEEFGEPITQDETYYIMDAGPNAEVYLGFQEDINRDQFQDVFEECAKSKRKADVEKYVQTFPSKKHDLFLIPAGTIHCSGKNNLVLEISNTPYIFTFKIYDWQRLDLDGNPRPLNISRALENLNFSREGKSVEKDFISKSEIQEEGDNWKIVNLPTHKDHLYSIHRLEFEKSIRVDTENRFHVLNLVEGESVYIISNHQKIKLRYAETIVIPATTGEYLIENCTNGSAKIVKAFMK
ncbi:MAG: ROK family protein [Balneolaceae bacterium]|nr:ROK family protein [Balneolaceae bacterium]